MAPKEKKSTQVALGGLASALCLLLMFMTGVIPFGEYALPAFAGIVIIAVVVENGCKTAVLVYAAVSVLAVFMVPVKEAALLFIFFFGYYPILQTKLCKIKPKVLQYALKFIIFNIAVIAAYMIVIYVLGIGDILDEFGSFGKYSALILLAMGNVFFVIYDYTVDNLQYIYIHWFRPKFLRRVG
ncbi:MAG: hypothetical protein RR332_05985 [Clostridiales bacterium]